MGRYKPPHYDIERDDKGWYLVWDRFDTMHGRRLGTYGEAEQLRERWIREDKEAADID